MARPKTEMITTEPASLTDEEASQLQREVDIKNAELALIVNNFGGGIPFSEEVYLQKTIYHLNKSAEELLEASKALLVAKAHLNHGFWKAYVQKAGLDLSIADRMVAVARKFYRPETTPVLQAAGNKSKLFELLVLDDDDLIKVAQGAEDAPVTLDEIDRMPTSELRKALREARADSEATKKVLADKNTKIDKLETQLEKAKTAEKPARPAPNYDVLALRTELTEKRYEFNIIVKHIGSILENLRACDEDYVETAQETFTALQEAYNNMTAMAGASLLEDQDWLPNPDDIEDADFIGADDENTH